jgi:hypothetical protein
MGPEFQAAWETLKGSGIGSAEATSHVSNLIRGSRWHLERLHIQHETLMEAIQKFNAGQLNRATFECHLLAAFLATASSYIVMGTMLGITVVARRLGLPDKEVLEDETPLVN